MPVLSGTRLGPYEIQGPLGAGGMGEVYRARDTRLGREVAIKLLPAAFSADPDRGRRFEQEARAASSLNHPNILTIYDVGTHEGSLFIVSELLEGETFRERLREGPLPLRKNIDYARQTASGLAAAHDKGIVHRDLKPENLFLTQDGRVKILDFGLAKLISPISTTDRAEAATVSDQKTAPGVIMGTVGYMSPEQVRGEPTDHRADLFSFGLILYEMLVGRRAFSGGSDVETMHAILKQEPPDLSETNPNLGPALARILRHCLEKRPQDRFQSAQDLSFALDALSGTDPTAAVSGLTKQAPRRRLWVSALALAAIALICLGWFLAAKGFGLLAEPAPTFRRLAFRRGTIPAARFHPDGQTIIYGAAWEGKPVELYSTRREAPESRPLGFPSSGILAISPKGELALSLGCRFHWAECQGTLAEAPLSGGAPREVVENVDHADWTPDGKTLAVVRDVDSRYRLEFPVGKVIYETQGWICDTRVSPKGDHIAFLENPPLGVVVSGMVSVVDLQGNKKTLSSGWKEIRGLAWRSQDEIWFTAGDVGAKVLRSVNLSGRQRVVLRMAGNPLLHDVSHDGAILLGRAEARAEIVARTQDGAQERDLSWFDQSWTADLSADGKLLLFTEMGEAVGANPTIYLRKTDGSDPVRLGLGTAQALSPDGKWVLAKQTSTPSQLLLLPTGAGAQKALPRGNLVEFFSASWFPDGSRILFAGEGPDRKPRSYIQDIDGGDPRPVAAEGMIASLISPDGTRFLALNPDGAYYVYTVAGGDATAIRGLEAADIPLQWSGDGRFLYVRGFGSMAANIFRVNLSNGHREYWKELIPPNPTGLVEVTFAPGAIRLTPDGKSYAYTYSTVVHQLYLVEGMKQ